MNFLSNLVKRLLGLLGLGDQQQQASQNSGEDKASAEDGSQEQSQNVATGSILLKRVQDTNENLGQRGEAETSENPTEKPVSQGQGMTFIQELRLTQRERLIAPRRSGSNPATKAKVNPTPEKVAETQRTETATTTTTAKSSKLFVAGANEVKKAREGLKRRPKSGKAPTKQTKELTELEKVWEKRNLGTQNKKQERMKALKG